MTLDNLRKLELSLMRQAFELACKRAGLSTARDTDITNHHAELASIVQNLVEQGLTDASTIASMATKTLSAKTPRD